MRSIILCLYLIKLVNMQLFCLMHVKFKPFFSSDDLLLYAGGMPRASFSDRHTITAQQGKKHVVFDFTSKVIDFFTIEATDDDKGILTFITFVLHRVSKEHVVCSNGYSRKMSLHLIVLASFCLFCKHT